MSSIKELLNKLNSTSKIESDTTQVIRNFYEVKMNAPNQIGIYIVRKMIKGAPKVVYIGRSTEEYIDRIPYGLRRRLKGHYRGAIEGNNKLFKHRDELHIELIPCDSIEDTKRLEAELIRKYNTVEDGWNERYED